MCCFSGVLIPRSRFLKILLIKNSPKMCMVSGNAVALSSMFGEWGRVYMMIFSYTLPV